MSAEKICKFYEITINSQEDLEILTEHLKGFKNTIEANDRQMRIVIFADQIYLSEALLRNWQNS